MTNQPPGALPLAEQLDSLAILGDPVRRRLFLHIAQAGDAVSRDGAAAAVAISRSLAAFHLDRLLEAGLLTAEFCRPPGRAGRGAGRPSKLYRLADRDFGVTIPPRQYELAARLFTDALAAIDRPPALDDAARTHGRSLGARARELAGPRAGRERLMRATEQVLAEQGYAPRPCEEGGLCLANCPFHALAERHRDLVCQTNHTLIEGVLTGAGIKGVAARLEQAPGRCCVVIGDATDVAPPGGSPPTLGLPIADPSLAPS